MLEQQSTSSGFSSLISEAIDVLSSWTCKPVFVICDSCFWCATYFDNMKIPSDNICPLCNAFNDDDCNDNDDNQNLSVLPITSNGSFTFHYNKKYAEEDKIAREDQ